MTEEEFGNLVEKVANRVVGQVCQIVNSQRDDLMQEIELRLVEERDNLESAKHPKAVATALARTILAKRLAEWSGEKRHYQNVDDIEGLADTVLRKHPNQQRVWG